MADRGEDAERVQIATQIARFDAAYRERLIACAALSDRVGQLGATFPLLLFALAARAGSIAERRAIVQRALDGFPLAEIAAALGLPLCLRRIPPEACHPSPFHVSWSVAASSRLGPHIPADAKTAARWLRAVAFAARFCDEEFACWIAAQRNLFASDTFEAGHLLPLAMFAWHSRSKRVSGSPMLSAPWSPRLGLRRALDVTERWLRELLVLSELGPRGLDDPWLPASQHLGYTFTPLLTVAALIEEACEMSNCADAYCVSLALHETRLFSMQRRGRRIATIEIEPDPRRDGFAIAQLQGPGNGDCGVDVWHAATEWLEHCDLRPSERAPPASSISGEERLEHLLQPYWRVPGRPDAPCAISFSALHGKVRRLYRCLDDASGGGTS